MAKQHFLFTSNVLSKRMFLEGAFRAMAFQGKRSLRTSKKLLADFFKVTEEQVFLFGAGRMSVYQLLKQLQLTGKDEVLVAGYTCVVLTNAVKFSGAKIKYVDISLEDSNPTFEAISNAITSETKVLILPHNFGIPMQDIAEVRAQFPDLIIIEDGAHTFGSKIASGQLCGTIGDASFFSLEYSKPLTTGLGGIMIINNTTLLPEFKKNYEKLPVWKGISVFRIFSTLKVYNLTYFRTTTFWNRIGLKLLRTLGLQYGTSQKEIDGVLPENYPVKLSPMLANFLPIQLKKIETLNKKRETIVREYEAVFQSYSQIQSISVTDVILVRYPLIFSKEVKTETIEKLKSEALSLGYNFGVWFNDVVHPSGSYRYGYSEGICPNGEWLSQRILNLPVNVNYPIRKQEMAELIALFEKYQIN